MMMLTLITKVQTHVSTVLHFRHHENRCQTLLLVGFLAMSTVVAVPQPPKGATARCKDGTYSFSKHHQGTCSHHGGVAQWYR